MQINRRNFIGSLLAATAGFAILPGAGRLWVPKRLIFRRWIGVKHVVGNLHPHGPPWYNTKGAAMLAPWRRHDETDELITIGQLQKGLRGQLRYDDTNLIICYSNIKGEDGVDRAYEYTLNET